MEKLSKPSNPLLDNTMNLLDITFLAGTLKHVAGNSGGEFAGPCPKCGGEDRFRVWPDHPSGAAGGKFYCRGCHWSGDGIAFLMEQEGMKYPEACRQLGQAPKMRRAPTIKVKDTWEPKTAILPGEDWQKAAGKFAAFAAGQMGKNKAAQEYAHGRGLTPETIQALRIGWNPSTLRQERESWGLPEEISDKTGKPKRIWLPSGLVIPSMDKNGNIVALKIRRSNWKPEDELPKYVWVSGGYNAPMVLLEEKGKPCVVVESELDAIFCAQSAGSLVTAIAMRSSVNRPDAATHRLLAAAPLILVSLDADEAGTKEIKWWEDYYMSAKWWPVPTGKDVGDMMATPGMVRAWIEAGLPEQRQEQPQPEMKPTPTACRAKTEPDGRPDADIARYAITYPHLVCCPRTTRPWNWINRAGCESCNSPCDGRK